MTDVQDDDPFLWLEDVHGEAALAWVRERNAESEAALVNGPAFAALEGRLLGVLDARDRIPSVVRRGPWFYNFWQDADHPRGLWRRARFESYCRREPDWQTLLDIDALAAAEGEDWVWRGATGLPPDWRRMLVSLSRGGADATVVREFDLETLAFVADGFTLPEAKSDVAWLDADTLLVGTDFGPGTLTDSGYPRIVKRWRRGTALAQAQVLFEGSSSDVSVWARVELNPQLPRQRRVRVGRSLDFYTTRVWVWREPQVPRDGAAATLEADEFLELDKPLDADLDLHGAWAALRLRNDWDDLGRRHPAGSLLVAPADALLAGAPDWRRVFTPSERSALDGWAWTRSHLLLNRLESVSNRVDRIRLPGRTEPAVHCAPAEEAWRPRPLVLPGPGTLSLSALHDPWTEDDALAQACLVQYTDFLTPDSLLLSDAGGAADAPARVLKQRDPQFDADGMRVEQREAVSADGTRVPYFLVWPAGADDSGPLRGDHPTLLYGYGGFEVSLQPWYSGGFGQAWYRMGGVLAVANIRGGGEFGPAWHQAAIRGGRQRSYDDFIAVAEDLIARGVTRPARLGIMGGSNGGLLVGAVSMQRPELFGAVVCQVPLLDMRRYHRLLAGASWMAEYGDPDDPADWAVLSRYSPYHQAGRGRGCPPMLLTTSTRDDRVHPGHARKMAARLRESGQPVLYHENLAGGHAGAADNRQRAHLQALEFSFLQQRLIDTAASSSDSAG